MTPEEQRIAIAEACSVCGYNTKRWKYSDHVEGDPSFQDSLGRVYLLSEIPDYLNDLNAMHEAEKVLDNMTPSGSMVYLNELEIVTDTCNANIQQWKFVTATASQRAEAFLKTIGKWKPSTVPKYDSQCEDKDEVLPSQISDTKRDGFNSKD